MSRFPQASRQQVIKAFCKEKPDTVAKYRLQALKASSTPNNHAPLAPVHQHPTPNDMHLGQTPSSPKPLPILSPPRTGGGALPSNPIMATVRQAIEAAQLLEAEGYKASLSFNAGPVKMSLERDEKIRKQAKTIVKYRRPPVYDSVQQGRQIMTDLVNSGKPFKQIKRFFKLWPDQDNLVEAIQDPTIKVIIVVGSRRTGKSTGLKLGADEYMQRTGNNAWLLGAKEDAASAILKDMCRDIFAEQYTDHLVAHYKGRQKMMGYVLLNGSELNIAATTVGSIRGMAGGLLWFEEFCIIMVEHPQVFADAVAVALSEPDMKLIMSSNQATGVFKQFMDDMKKYPDKVAIFDFTGIGDDATCPHVEILGNSNMVHEMMSSVMDTEYADSQLKNTESHRGEVFNSKAVMDAFNQYDEWATSFGIITENNLPLYDPVKSYVCLDPGFGHPTGIVVVHALRAHCWCDYANDLTGAEVEDDDEILRLAGDLATEFGAEIIIENGQWGSSYWMKKLRNRGFTVHGRRFQGRGKANDRSDHIKHLNGLLNSRRFHTDQRNLKKGLGIYNPEMREKQSEGYKGDKVDALLLGAKMLENYLMEEGEIDQFY